MPVKEVPRLRRQFGLLTALRAKLKKKIGYQAKIQKKLDKKKVYKIKQFGLVSDDRIEVGVNVVYNIHRKKSQYGKPHNKIEVFNVYVNNVVKVRIHAVKLREIKGKAYEGEAYD